jgi:hypothetical protein
MVWRRRWQQKRQRGSDGDDGSEGGKGGVGSNGGGRSKLVKGGCGSTSQASVHIYVTSECVRLRHYRVCRSTLLSRWTDETEGTDLTSFPSFGVMMSEKTVS